MPRPSRDERRAQLARIGRQWGQWLRTAMTENATDTKTLVERARQAGASFDRSNVSKWRAGDNTADPTNAVLIARVLGLDPDKALRAAGHDALADAYTYPDEAAMRAREAELRAHIADLEAQIDRKLDRLNAIPEAGEPDRNGDPRAS